MRQTDQPMDTVNMQRPAIVTWLGYGGLLPFLALALASALDANHREL